MGVPHSERGVMTATSTDPNRNNDINTTNVQNTVRDPIRGNNYNDGRGRATLHTVGDRVKPPQTNRAQRRFRNGQVRENE